ncbi:hypothetical protein NHH03_18605 [Stieleria sp. TO1_6]|uniref:hypothetical protein n=1 Tax=Stieleria tagensis TaxID=2956795 RepID=UPI00209B3CF4|nr:hypothetical protein [Stieleria tagensis]MCO8123764.1 hypothetical protein [Stieleria tagensis]
MLSRSIQNPYQAPELIRRWRRGRIVMQAGKLVRIERRWSTGSVSMAQVWWQSRYGRPNDNLCWLDYHQPWGMPGFLTLDYIRSGRRAGYKSLIGACRVLDEIACLRGASAIVAHISTASISDRFLQRIGWQRHLESWSGRHWIRRFYDGYPDGGIERYLDSHEFSEPRDSVLR